MKWEELLKLFKNQPVIETFMLVDKISELPKIRVQLSRWVKTGKLIKIKNGLYALPDAYKANPVDLEYIATFAIRPSYISLEYALASYGLIPEMVPNLTLITTKRPQKLRLKERTLIYRHVDKKHFWGYVSKGRKNFETFFAEPEKALLDQFYFSEEKLSDSYFSEMRFQNTEELDLKKLMEYASRFKSPKILKWAKHFCEFANKERRMKEL